MSVEKTMISSRVRQDRVTISDLSRELGLTKGTISRALNGYTDISERTRLRVEKTAERMGYRPLIQAQAIRTGRSQSLGYVIQTGDYDAQKPFLAEFLAGACSAAASEGWTLSISEAETLPDLQLRMRQLVQDRKADGFILPRTWSDDPRVSHLRDLEVPFVLYGRVENPAGCAWYDVKGGAAMRDAVARLSALGHRRIAYIGGGRLYHYEKLRLRGYLSGLEQAGLPFDQRLVLEDVVTLSQGRMAASALMKNDGIRPTALIYAVDAAAKGAWDAAVELGIDIGTDLSVVSYGCAQDNLALKPSLARYEMDIRRAGHQLAHLLIRRIRGELPETLRVEEDAVYMPGASVAPVRMQTT